MSQERVLCSSAAHRYLESQADRAHCPAGSKPPTSESEGAGRSMDGEAGRDSRHARCA